MFKEQETCDHGGRSVVDDWLDGAKQWLEGAQANDVPTSSSSLVKRPAFFNPDRPWDGRMGSWIAHAGCSVFEPTDAVIEDPKEPEAIHLNHYHQLIA